MMATDSWVQRSVYTRILWLYGLHTLLSNAALVTGYYLLPEGFMRGSPQAAVAGIVASQETFWQQMGLTLLFNLSYGGILAVVLNLNVVRGFPAGYLIPIAMGVITGLILGTNSFGASDLSQYSVRDGMALGITVGGLEMLGYILVIASTVKLGVYHYRSWWRWSGEWKPVKVMRLRDVRLSTSEVALLLLGILLITAGAYRETAMMFEGW
jgi:hypothetical protein